MFDYKIFLGLVSVIISVACYVPYFKDIVKGTTKPHVFSWLVWSLLTGIAFFAQLTNGAGAGAWVTGVSSLACLAVAIVALRYGEKNITPLDWWAFGGALVSLGLWGVTANALLAVILVTITDALAFVPTFRKSYYKPDEETITTFALSALKFIIVLWAFEVYDLVVWLYPVALVIMNSSFVAMVLVRRRKKI